MWCGVLRCGVICCVMTYHVSESDFCLIFLSGRNARAAERLAVRDGRAPLLVLSLLLASAFSAGAPSFPSHRSLSVSLSVSLCLFLCLSLCLSLFLLCLSVSLSLSLLSLSLSPLSVSLSSLCLSLLCLSLSPLLLPFVAPFLFLFFAVLSFPFVFALTSKSLGRCGFFQRAECLCAAGSGEYLTRPMHTRITHAHTHTYPLTDYTYVRTHTHTNTNTRVHTYVCTYTHVLTYVHTYTRARINTHTTPHRSTLLALITNVRPTSSIHHFSTPALHFAWGGAGPIL